MAELTEAVEVREVALELACGQVNEPLIFAMSPPRAQPLTSRLELTLAPDRFAQAQERIVPMVLQLLQEY
jgi:hypothetical protein